MNPTDYSLIGYKGLGMDWVPNGLVQYLRGWLQVLRASKAQFRYTFGLRGAPCLCGPWPLPYDGKEKTLSQACATKPKQRPERFPCHARA